MQGKFSGIFERTAYIFGGFENLWESYHLLEVTVTSRNKPQVKLNFVVVYDRP